MDPTDHIDAPLRTSLSGKVEWLAIEKVLVPGKSLSGHVALPEDHPQPGTIYVIDKLNRAKYSRVAESSAVICEECHPTSHMTVVCRILGVPVLQLSDATNKLRPGQFITVDLANNRFSTDAHAAQAIEQQAVGQNSNPISGALMSSLRFQVSITDSPKLIKRVNDASPTRAAQFFLRSELLWLAHGEHPLAFCRDNGVEATASVLVDSLRSLTAELEPDQTLNFRGLDLRSDQIGLTGFESPRELNPELGVHGVRQLLKYPDYLRSELLAVDMLYSANQTNVIYSLPFLTLEQELQEVRAEATLSCHNAIKIGIFVETPAALFELPYLVREGISAVYLGTKDLTQLMLAADRQNLAVSHLLDLTHRPMLNAIATAVRTCTDADVPLFVFAMPSDLETLLDSVPGISGISLPASDFIRLVRTT